MCCEQNLVEINEALQFTMVRLVIKATFLLSEFLTSDSSPHNDIEDLPKFKAFADHN